jgi:hypothetical protein
MIALVGLALDGGNMFLQRRQVQNAVDAASMAGTRELARAICGEAGAGDQSIAEAINSFAESNGIEDTDGVPGNGINDNVSAIYVNFNLDELGQVGAGNIPLGATGIAVNITAEKDTYFVRVVGINDFSVGAGATAMTSPPSSAGGLRPVAVPLAVLDIVGVGDELTFQFGNKCDDGTSCAVAWTSHGGGTMSHRGWVALGWAWNQGESPDWGRDKIKNVSNANVKEWMENGYHDNPFYADNVGGEYGDFVHASPGERQSAIAAAPIGEVIILPVFDYFVQYKDIPAPKAPPAAGANDDYYHVVGFIGVRVTDILPTNQHAFVGTVENIIMGFGQVSPDDGYGQANACETHMMVINLWE